MGQMGPVLLFLPFFFLFYLGALGFLRPLANKRALLAAILARSSGVSFLATARPEKSDMMMKTIIIIIMEIAEEGEMFIVANKGFRFR